MKKDEIVQYLSCVVDIEKNIYSLDCSIKDLEEKKSHLGISNNWIEPTKPIEPKLERLNNWYLEVLIGIALIIVPYFIESIILVFLGGCCGLGLIGFAVFGLMPERKERNQ